MIVLCLVQVQTPSFGIWTVKLRKRGVICIISESLVLLLPLLLRSLFLLSSPTIRRQVSTVNRRDSNLSSHVFESPINRKLSLSGFRVAKIGWSGRKEGLVVLVAADG
jgi:hypothetical protein